MSDYLSNGPIKDAMQNKTSRLVELPMNNNTFLILLITSENDFRKAVLKL